MKTLVLDIETSPNKAYVWGLWNQNVNPEWISADGHILCYAAKWYGTEKVMFDSIHRSSQRAMLKGIHKTLSESDIVITYNGRKFDLPTLNKEFVQLGMSPPAPYKNIDLLPIVRNTFRFPSNKLSYVTKALGLMTKAKHSGPQLWIDCMAGEPSAWREMERYNKRDVTVTEILYKRLLPWIRNHPNLGLYIGSDSRVCPNCGSKKLQRRGFAYTINQKYERLQCVSCGRWCRGTKRVSMRPEVAPLL